MPDLDYLVTVAQGVHAVTGAVNSLIVAGEGGQALLVDTGQDADAGRRIKRALGRLQLEPTVILNTHSHADHFGGNAYLLRQFPDLKVMAPKFEAAIIREPFLEPVYLFHGADPPPELRSKWLMAPASPVHEEVEAGERELCGVPLVLIDVKGHAHRQLAVRVGRVLFAADGVFGARTMERYPLLFAQNVSDQLASLTVIERCLESGVELLLPGHGEPTDDGRSLVAANRATIERALEVVSAACVGYGTEEVLARTADALGLEMSDLARYHLNLCTVSAYLSHLRNSGLVETQLAHGKLTWRKIA